jgi:hypothetical protein
MSRIAPGALLACVALVATIVWESQNFSELDVPEAGERSITKSVAHAPAGPATKDVAQGWLTMSLERPLFRENRRPLQVSGDPASRADEPTRLTGVMTGPFGNRALFLTAGNPKPIVAQEGSHVGDFVVLSIEPGQAVIQSGETTRTLQPVFAESSKKSRH